MIANIAPIEAKGMKLIVVTTPTFFVEEDQIINALFEEGLDILHLRKPDAFFPSYPKNTTGKSSPTSISTCRRNAA